MECVECSWKYSSLSSFLLIDAKLQKGNVRNRRLFALLCTRGTKWWFTTLTVVLSTKVRRPASLPQAMYCASELLGRRRWRDIQIISVQLSFAIIFRTDKDNLILGQVVMIVLPPISSSIMPYWKDNWNLFWKGWTRLQCYGHYIRLWIHTPCFQINPTSRNNWWI